MQLIIFELTKTSDCLNDAQFEYGSFADIYQRNKKEIGNLIKRISKNDFAFDKEVSKWEVLDEDTYIFYHFKELLKDTTIIDKYYEEQERISNMSDVYTSYERKELHEEVAKKYRREYKDLLSEKYHEKWDEKIIFNENASKINEQIKSKNLKKDCAENYCIQLCKIFGYDDTEAYDLAISYRNSVEIELKNAEEKRKQELIEKRYEEDKKVLEDWRNKQIEKGNITYLKRVENEPSELFFLDKIEMEGKYGWFDASGRYYNLPKYYSGYLCKNKRVYNEYLKRIPHYRNIEDLQGTKKIATDLTITIFKSSAFKTLSQTFKRRSTTTKPRLVSYTINGLSASANLNQFVDKTKLTALKFLL